MTSTETTLMIRLIEKMDAVLGAMNDGRARWSLKDAAASLAISEDNLKARLAKRGLKFGRGERISFSANVYREVLTDLQKEEQERMGRNHGQRNRQRAATRSSGASIA